MIELLESRIAPAAVFYFTDIDGDHVKITSSKGTNNDLATSVHLGNSAMPAVGYIHPLNSITLGSGFAGASISITATPSTDLSKTAGGSLVISGDGFVNVGLIDASSIDLKSVTVHGDLGQIRVGDSTASTPGLGSLNVQSMGDFGLTTGANSTESFFENGVTSINIAHDLNGVFLHAIATGSAPTAKIGKVFIGGNIIGGANTDTGEIAGPDGIGSVKVLGNVEGGAGMQSGRIASSAGSTIGSIFIGGSLVGGSNQASGVIFSPALLKSVFIKGSVTGGSAVTTGGIDAGTLGSLVIGGDLAGGQFSSSSAVDHSGFIRTQANINSAIIGGSIISGQETGGGTLTLSGTVQAGQTLESLKVIGGVQGNATTPVVISGEGLAAAAIKGSDLAIKSISVGGTVNYGRIEAGYDLNGNGNSGDGQIGAVAIKGDLIATDIVAGVRSSDAYFGNGGDFVINNQISAGPPVVTANSDGVYSSIASIIVGGQIEGTAATGDSFGIEAQLIGSLKTGNVLQQLTKGPGNDFLSFSQTTGHDVHVRELMGS